MINKGIIINSIYCACVVVGDECAVEEERIEHLQSRGHAAGTM